MRNVLLARQLELIICNGFLFTAKTNGLADKQARQVHVRNLRSNLERLAVWKTFYPPRIGQTESLPHEPVRVGFRARPQPDPEEQVQRNRLAGFAFAVQAVWAGVFGRKPGIGLQSVSVLNVPVPGLRLVPDDGVGFLRPGRPLAAKRNQTRGECGPDDRPRARLVGTAERH